jgi:hypothetical protein
MMMRQEVEHSTIEDVKQEHYTGEISVEGMMGRSLL